MDYFESRCIDTWGISGGAGGEWHFGNSIADMASIRKCKYVCIATKVKMKEDEFIAFH